jgi:NAD(P)H dehydrogenase (quinone)
MHIAITGATGQLGRLVIAGLVEKGAADDVIALARSPEKGADLGVQVRHADYDVPETLGAALDGVGTLLLISGTDFGNRTAQHKAVIDAAVQAGVNHIIYTSVLSADTSALGLLAAEHNETEALIKATGLTYTFLRNGWYTENYAGSVPGALQSGALVGSAGVGRIASAARVDYAAAAVAVLTGAGHANKTYELAGDTAYTLADMAAEISALSGKIIPYNHMPAEAYAEVLTSVGLPQGVAQFIAGADVAASKGALFSESKTLSQLIGRPTTPLSEVISTVIG